MRIADSKKGDRIRLLDFGQTDLRYKRKLLSLGITKGIEVEVVRKAPFGCPIQIVVRGIMLTLRKEETAHILWELV